jgi:hypothetical protein
MDFDQGQCECLECTSNSSCSSGRFCQCRYDTGVSKESEGLSDAEFETRCGVLQAECASLGGTYFREDPYCICLDVKFGDIFDAGPGTTCYDNFEEVADFCSGGPGSNWVGSLVPIEGYCCEEWCELEPCD